MFILCLALVINVNEIYADTEKEASRITSIAVKYTVQQGDTLSEIAQAFDIKVNQLVMANKLASSVIQPSQILTIPTRGYAGNISRGSFSSGDVLLLAKAIYAEARGENFEGQVAVGAVILNRLHSPLFPDSVRGVIFQRNKRLCQFTPVSDGTINLNPDNKAIKAATVALNGYDPTFGSLFFYNPHIASDTWIKTLPVVTRIGKHVFATKA